MYDLYPEWGPTRHRDHDDTEPQRRARYWQASSPGQESRLVLASGPQPRDADAERPDDN